MAHWIVDDHGFGGSYYKCSNCGEGYWDILDDIDTENCQHCGSPMEEDATVYMRNGKERRKNDMKFEYQKSTNIKEGQKLFGIIAPSIYTYDGVYPVTVSTIDYNEEDVIFVVDQPCGCVKCSFREMGFLVFESEEEAKQMLPRLEFGMGLYAY